MPPDGGSFVMKEISANAVYPLREVAVSLNANACFGVIVPVEKTTKGT
jgi:hypothetical protein